MALLVAQDLPAAGVHAVDFAAADPLRGSAAAGSRVALFARTAKIKR